MRTAAPKHSMEAIEKRAMVRGMRLASAQNGKVNVVVSIETIKKQTDSRSDCDARCCAMATSDFRPGKPSIVVHQQQFPAPCRRNS